MSLAEFAAQHGLERVGARPPLREYIRETLDRRTFAWTLSRYTVESSDARTRLGSWWVVLMPAIQAALYGLIFGVIIGDSRPHNFLAYLFTGVFLFGFMSGCLQNGSSSITGNAGLVKSLSFPRVLLPISAIIRQILNFLPQIGLLVITLLLTGNFPKWSWLLVAFVLVLMTLFGLGLALIASRINAEHRDLAKLIPLVTRLAFYVSGVFFSLETVLGKWPIALQIVSFNPFYDYIQLTRGLMIGGYEPSALLWWQCIGWALVTFVVGVIYFWKAEELYGRED